MKINTRYFSDVKSLAKKMYEDSLKSEEKIADALLFYDEASKLLKEFMKMDDVTPSLIELEDPEYDGYDKEFMFSIAWLDGKCIVDIEKEHYVLNGEERAYRFCGNNPHYVDPRVSISLLRKAILGENEELVVTEVVLGGSEFDTLEPCDYDEPPVSYPENKVRQVCELTNDEIIGTAIELLSELKSR